MERMSNEALGLSEHQATIGDRVIAEEEAKREHLVVYLSGAHAYGFPSPDSDLDLKCIHIAPTGALVGFEPPAVTFDRAEIIEGVEIDYGMKNGRVTVPCRQAMLFYTLRTLNFEPNGTPRKGEKQVVIANLAEIKSLLPKPGQA